MKHSGPTLVRSAARRLGVAAFILGLGLASCQTEAPEATNDEVPAETPRSWFVEATRESGLDFRHRSGVSGQYSMVEIMGSGLCVFDADGDEDLDVYLVDSGSGPDALDAPNRFFRQESPGAFVDATKESGLGDRGYGMGCAVGDADNDGDLDVYVANFGEDAFYVNRGDGSFFESSAKWGVSGKRWSTSASFFDFDRDGFLDLYVAAYVNYAPPRACSDSTGRPEYCGPDAFVGTPDTLYRNNGDGSFSDVSAATGIGSLSGKGLGVLTSDFNEDDWPDVYVANDGEENFLWINDGGGRFDNEALTRGAAFNMFGAAEASMGLAAGDVDGDGDLDFLSTHLDRETNTLYMNLGEGVFEDATAATGVGASSLPYTGFGTSFFDFDLDGDVDLAVANGKVRRGASRGYGDRAAEPDNPLKAYAEPNLFYENDGEGRLVDVSAAAGRLTSLVEVSRGLVSADMDGDGDLDVLLTNCNGPVRYFRNDAPRKGRWLRLRAFDPRLKRDAVGAVATIFAGDLRSVRLVSSTSGYLSGGPSELHFGLGERDSVDRIEVRWPDGRLEAFPGGPADVSVAVRKGEGRVVD